MLTNVSRKFIVNSHELLVIISKRPLMIRNGDMMVIHWGYHGDTTQFSDKTIYVVDIFYGIFISTVAAV